MPRSRGKTRTPARGAVERPKSTRPSAAPRRTRRPGGVPLAWAAVVATVATAVYANSLGGGLLYDDVNAIRGNAVVIDGDVAGILTTPSWWGDGRGHLWRPLTTLTFALDHALYGLAPFGYHVVNVALHAVVSVLVLVVFAAEGVGPAVAVGAAVLFAAHPVHTEVVANIVGRAELLAAAGFFLAWWCWRAADAAVGTRAIGWVAAATAAYFFAMLGKENAVALPAVLVFADVLRARERPWTEVVRGRAPRYAALIGAAVAFTALRIAVTGRVTPTTDLLDNPLSLLPLGSRLMTAIAVVGLYALRLVFPLRLSADYSYDQIPAVTSPLDAGFVAGLAVIVAVLALAWWAWRHVPAIALGVAVLVLTFLVVSNLVFLIGTIMGERLIYLPSAGFCLALAAGLAWIGGVRRDAARWPVMFTLPVVAITVLYGMRTVARNAVWREPLGFFQQMVVDAPRSARSHRELGSELAEAGRFAEATQAFERSLAIKPEDANTLYNWGNALSGQGNWDAAADTYRRAIAAKPNFAQAYENLGNVESARGDQQAALVAMRRSFELSQSSPYLLMNMANVYFRAGSLAEARATYEQALAQGPVTTELLTNYGMFLYGQSDFAAAAGVLARIAPPAPARALVALAVSQQQLGHTAEAQATRASALRLHPRDPGVQQMEDFFRRGPTTGDASP